MMTDERKELIERWAREERIELMERWARQAGAQWDPHWPGLQFSTPALERFAVLVRADDDRILRASVPERWKDCASAIGAVQSYIAELEGAVSRARADALEEAAKVCDEERLGDLKACDADNYYDAAVGHCADAIRKLIQAP